MRRTIRPCLESLEGKALLSGVSATTSGLAYSLTAVAERTLTGAQVVETLTETNVSNQEITVTQGATDEGFFVSQGGKTIWNPYEGILPQSLSVATLKPHQSLTISGTWDDRGNDLDSDAPWAEGPPLSGTFTISNSQDQGGVTASVTIPKSWTVPVKMTHISPPKAPPVVHIMSTVNPLAKEG
jgi:hypothetical protein